MKNGFFHRRNLFIDFKGMAMKKALWSVMVGMVVV